MTTAMDGLSKARSFLNRRLAEMSEEDRAAVIELLQIAGSPDCEDEAEVNQAITELLLPDSFAGPIDEDDDDDRAKERVEAYRKKVGSSVRALRTAKGMTQDELAKATGLPQSHISRIEKGKHASTFITIQRLASALGTTPSQIDPGFDD